MTTTDDGKLTCCLCGQRVSRHLMHRFIPGRGGGPRFEDHTGGIHRWLCGICWRRRFHVEQEA